MLVEEFVIFKMPRNNRKVLHTIHCITCFEKKLLITLPKVNAITTLYQSDVMITLKNTKTYTYI